MEKKVYVYGSVNDLLAMKIKMHQQSCAKRNNIQEFMRKVINIYLSSSALMSNNVILSSFYSSRLVSY